MTTRRVCDNIITEVVEMRVIAEFEWDNPNNKINITSIKEVNDLFWRATEDYGEEYVATKQQLEEYIKNGNIIVQDNKIIFRE